MLEADSKLKTMSKTIAEVKEAGSLGQPATRTDRQD